MTLVHEKHVNKIKCIMYLISDICLITFMMLLLQGCGSEKFTQEQAQAIVEEGRPILEEYVSSVSDEAHIINVSMLYGCNQGEPSFNAKYPSHVVKANFLAGDKQYIAIVNLEDGTVYSDYDSIDPNELIQRQLMMYCDEYGFNGTYGVTGAFYSYAFVSHQMEVSRGDIRDTYVYIDNIPNLSPVENADEFMNASISGFDITYEAEKDEVFDQAILYKYLYDTGNYRKEDMRGDNREYHITGGRKVENFVNGEPVYFDVNILSEGEPDTMICDEMRWDYTEEDEFCYLYVGGTKNENIKRINGAEYIEYKCPFEYSGEELTYTRDENNPYEGFLYMKNPEWNEITRKRYTLTNKSSDEKVNDKVDRWELDPIGEDELEINRSDSADLFELYIKGTRNKCEFTDDKVVILFR